MSLVYAKDAKPLMRYDVFVNGVVFAIDLSRQYDRDGGMYANVRLSPYGNCWKRRTLMFTNQGSKVISKKNVAKFYIEKDGKCRAVIGKKEKFLNASDKGAVSNEWQPYALALKIRTDITEMTVNETEVIE